METKAILASLYSERDRINCAISAIESLGVETSTGSKRGRPSANAAKPTAAPKKRKMSAAGRKRIAQAQRARWAAKRAAEKKPVAKGRPAAKKTAAKPKKKSMSAATKKRLSELAKKRWAARKAAAPEKTA